MNIFEKINQTFQREGFITTIKKILQNVFIRVKRNLSYHRKNMKKWNKLRGKFNGKRVFLIANGPSLNEMPLYLLKNEYTICFNRINVLFDRLSWKPTFYACIDETVLLDSLDEIKHDILPNVTCAFFPEWARNKGLHDKENIYWLYYNFNKYSFNAPYIARSPSVSIAALQILPFLGFTEIYIIGMDMNYKIHSTATSLKGNEIQSNDDDDPNHFDPRYFGKGKKYHQPNADVVKNIFDSLKSISIGIKNTKTKIFNSTLGGKVEYFERIKFESLFNYSESEKFTLFSETFRKYLNVKSFDELISKYQVYKEINDIFDSNVNIFLLEQANNGKKIQKLLDKYLVYGPYRNYFLLIKRSIAIDNF